MNKQTVLVAVSLILIAGSLYLYYLGQQKTTVTKISDTAVTAQPTINISALITSKPSPTLVMYDTYLILKKYPDELVLSKENRQTSIPITAAIKVFRMREGNRVEASPDELYEGMQVEVKNEGSETAITIVSSILQY